MDYEELSRRVGARPLLRRREHAVLVPVVEVDGESSLLFEKRAATLRTQPGEICLPGGSVEAGETPLAAACREMEEELGLGGELVQAGPPLPPAYHRLGEVTYPFLAHLTPEWREGLRWERAEVAEVFTVPLAFFQQTPPERYVCRILTVPPEGFPNEKIGFPQGYRWAEGEMEVPLWMWEGRAIWGLTARIVCSLLEAL